jgi:hypothetical protein
METAPAGTKTVVALIACAAGIAIVAAGVVKGMRGSSAEDFMAVPAGLVFVFLGMLLALPERFARFQRVLGALLVTSFAAIFDWIAFGSGERHFISSLGLGGGGAAWSGGELAGRIFFGLFAVLMDIAAVGLWIKAIRGPGEADARGGDQARVGRRDL